MRNPVHLLARQLTGKPTLEDCSLDEVKRIAQRYPYFAAAQFLLLQKLRQSGPAEEEDAQYKKAVLFHPDPLAFALFIASDKFHGDEAAEPFLPAYEEVAEKQQGGGNKGSDQKTFAEEDGNVARQPEPPERSFLPAADNDKTKENLFAEQGGADSPAAVDKKDATDALPAEEPQTSAPVVNDERPKEEPAQELPAFEPYHTVDYFASQGINVSPDELRKDKLGRQLKSFTEWLKTMKRLPAPQTTGAPESPAEKGVEKLADRSLSDSEVFTEAMAEVWAKQGATQKALDIYNKLSLHNPSKSDYFAAKIETLKQL